MRNSAAAMGQRISRAQATNRSEPLIHAAANEARGAHPGDARRGAQSRRSSGETTGARRRLSPVRNHGPAPAREPDEADQAKTQREEPDQRAGPTPREARPRRAERRPRCRTKGSPRPRDSASPARNPPAPVRRARRQRRTRRRVRAQAVRAPRAETAARPRRRRQDQHALKHEGCVHQRMQRRTVFATAQSAEIADVIAAISVRADEAGGSDRLGCEKLQAPDPKRPAPPPGGHSKRYCPMPGKVPMPLHKIVSITSSAPPAMEARRPSRKARLTGVSFM